MTAKMFFGRLGAVLLVLVTLMASVYSPVLASEEAEVKGTIDKKVSMDELPEHAIEHGIIKMLVVDGVHVLITKDTIIDGMLKLGAEVEAEGMVHAIFADKIEVIDDAEDGLNVGGKDVGLEGTIEKIIAEFPHPEHAMAHGIIKALVVNGVKVGITEDTVIDGTLMIGAGVKIDGTLHAIFATEIEVED